MHSTPSSLPQLLRRDVDTYHLQPFACPPASIALVVSLSLQLDTCPLPSLPFATHHSYHDRPEPPRHQRLHQPRRHRSRLALELRNLRAAQALLQPRLLRRSPRALPSERRRPPSRPQNHQHPRHVSLQSPLSPQPPRRRPTQPASWHESILPSTSKPRTSAPRREGGGRAREGTPHALQFPCQDARGREVRCASTVVHGHIDVGVVEAGDCVLGNVSGVLRGSGVLCRGWVLRGVRLEVLS